MTNFINDGPMLNGGEDRQPAKDNQNQENEYYHSIWTKFSDSITWKLRPFISFMPRRWLGPSHVGMYDGVIPYAVPEWIEGK